MKTLLFLLVSFISFVLVAQTPQAVRYQAVVRNSTGAIVANQNVMLHVSVLQGGPSGALVYKEEHTLFSNAFGLIGAEIGNGYALSGNFSVIDWAAGDMYLKTEISCDGGNTYDDMGTSSILSVPYALYADYAASADESDPTSWKKTGNINTNPSTHFIGTTDNQNLSFRTNNIERMIVTTDGALAIGAASSNINTGLLVGSSSTGKGVVFVGGSGSPQSPPFEGAGSRMMWYPYKSAFRVGSVTSTYWNNDSIGTSSFAANWNTRANGSMSTAFGSATQAAGISSFAAGINTTAYGYYSAVFGSNATAQANNSFVIGRYNVVAGSSSAWIGTDPLFVIGIGTSSASRKNALVVLKNGNTGIGVDAPSTGNQLEVGNSLNGGNVVFFGGTGSPSSAPSGESTRMAWIPAKSAFRAGHSGTISWDFNNIGDYSVAFGYSTTARGNYSAAFGDSTTASAQSSFSCGNNNLASGINSFASGNKTHATAKNASSFGYLTQADGENSVAIGDLAYTYGDNSMAIGYFTTADAYCSVVLGRNNVSSGTNSSWISTEQLLVAGNGTGMTPNNAMTLYKNGNMTISGTLTQSSDIRLKTNIRPLTGALSQIQLVQPIYYEFKDKELHPGGTQIGFSAQEIQKSWPELVREDENGYLSVDYAGMTVVLLQAVKEQQQMIMQLQKEVEQLKNK